MKQDKPTLVRRYLARKERQLQPEGGGGRPDGWKEFNFIFSYVLTLAILLFFSVQLGSLADRLFHCGPWVSVALGGLTIVSTFRVMVKEVLSRGGAQPPREGGEAR